MKNIIIYLAAVILLTSCFEEKIIVPDGEITTAVAFEVEISQKNIFDLNFRDDAGQPIARIGAEVLTDLPENNGLVLFTAFTDSNGDISTSIHLPSNINTLVLKINHSGTVKYFPLESINGSYELQYIGTL
tara:strand:- start:188 stop:580 length:393 start_codon:yes stop_codon:yes gene_type:complete